MITLERGNRLTFDDHVYTFRHQTLHGDYVFECPENGVTVNRTLREISEAFVKGDLEGSLPLPEDMHGWQKAALYGDWKGVRKDHRDIAERRQDYCKAILAEGKPGRQKTSWPPIIAAIAAEKGEVPPPWETVRRWLTRYINRKGDIRALIPGFSGRGRKRREMDQEEAEFLAVILGRYETIERVNASAIVRRVSDEFINAIRTNPRAANWKIPCPSTVRRRIKDMDPYQVTVARYDKKIADLMFKKVGAGYTARHRLEVVELDHTVGNIFIVDTELKQILGRPTICAAICKKTRMLVGLYVGFEPPGDFSLLQCLRNMLLPKDYIAEEFGNETSIVWPAYGKPVTLVVDNAVENHGESFRNATACLGIDIRYAPVKCPEFKGTIERFFGSLSTQGLTWLPGKTFNSPKEKGTYPAEKQACIDLRTFRLVLHEWLIAIYCNGLHTGINAVPAQCWDQEVKKMPIRLPYGYQEIDRILGVAKTYIVQRTGIKIAGLNYQSNALNAIARLPKDKRSVLVTRDPSDVGRISVRHPITGDLIWVLCDLPAVSGTSIYQNAGIQKIAREKAYDHMNRQNWVECRIAYYERCDAIAARSNASMKERRHSARARGGDNVSQPKTRVSAPAPIYDDDILAEITPRPLHPSDLAPAPAWLSNDAGNAPLQPFDSRPVK